MADFKVRVNCIAPGPIDTDLIKGASSDLISKVVKNKLYHKNSKQMIF